MWCFGGVDNGVPEDFRVVSVSGRVGKKGGTGIRYVVVQDFLSLYVEGETE